jgi:hypothetical protein
MDMNVSEITKRLYAINEAVIEKTGRKPVSTPSIVVAHEKCTVIVRGHSYECKHIASISGGTFEAALDAADAFIAAMPALEAAKLQAHMARVADCIDKAHADGIADEFVTPLRVTVKAMSDNLLSAPALEATP